MNILTKSVQYLLLYCCHSHISPYCFVSTSLITRSWARDKQSCNETYYMTDIVIQLHAGWRVPIGCLTVESVYVQTGNFCWENFRVNFKINKLGSGSIYSRLATWKSLPRKQILSKIILIGILVNRYRKSRASKPKLPPCKTIRALKATEGTKNDRINFKLT